MASRFQTQTSPASVFSGGRRLAFELLALIILKICLLLALYYVCFAPFPRPAQDAPAIERVLSPHASHGDR
ncbi:MAG: cytochrome oxidase putative small subunit CydP [Rhodanobacteraceae bacterium]